jgi:hypothetical protein
VVNAIGSQANEHPTTSLPVEPKPYGVVVVIRLGCEESSLGTCRGLVAETARARIHVESMIREWNRLPLAWDRHGSSTVSPRLWDMRKWWTDREGFNYRESARRQTRVSSYRQAIPTSDCRSGEQAIAETDNMQPLCRSLYLETDEGSQALQAAHVSLRNSESRWLADQGGIGSYNLRFRSNPATQSTINQHPARPDWPIAPGSKLTRESLRQREKPLLISKPAIKWSTRYYCRGVIEPPTPL